MHRLYNAMFEVDRNGLCISELCYDGQFYKGIIGHFVNSMAKKFGSHNMTVLYPNPCYNEVCYKGIALCTGGVFVRFDFRYWVVFSMAKSTFFPIARRKFPI